jgi:adenylate cyclase
MSILLGLTLVTVAGLGYNSYRNARFIAHDLSQQILQQTSLRVDHQINDLLHSANEQGALNLRLLQAGQFDARDFHRLAAYWTRVLEVHPRLARLSFGLEATGEWSYVRRRPDGRLAVAELRRNRATGQLGLRDWWPEDYPQGQPFFSDPDKSDEDPRQQSWYLAAKQARRQTWSETYVFFGTEGVPDTPGISCAIPVYRQDDSLLGVLGASFGLLTLSHFLTDLEVGETGYAFVVEFGRDGARRLIAHPHPEILLHAAPAGAAGPVRELAPLEGLADQRVPAFLRACALPADFQPADLQEMQRTSFSYGGVAYFGSYHCLSTRDTPDWLICTLIPQQDILARVEANNRETLLIGLGILLAAVAVGLVVSRQVAAPLEQLAKVTEGIGRLEVESLPVVHSLVLEVDRLAVTMEDTKTSLRSFQKYVPADLVRRLLSSGQEARLGGETKVVTVYFCDLADFSAVAERLGPQELVRLLGEYFGTFSAQIMATGGTVDKYVGDAIMAFWGAPAPHPAAALAACTAALRNQNSLKALRGQWQAEGKPPLFARIGLHLGEVVVGNVGSPARLNYTAIGDAVNLASRLEGLNKYYGTEIVISEAVYQEVRAAVVARPLDYVSVKGKARAVRVFELLGLKGETDQAVEDLTELSAQALARYQERRWAEAIELFERVLQLRPGDAPARAMIARCRAYQATPPPPVWDGVHRLDQK